MDIQPVDLLCINTLRVLAADMVEAAHSGHPGMPLGAAVLGYGLWTQARRHNPANPLWPNRDRFVLSAGHGSALLYALLHLTGYDLPLEELKRFRQWGSRTPGHPEFGITPGVEATTGPLGQGVANGVGMAIAEQYLASHFNRPGFPLVDHATYVLCSDGDMMEGISAEAVSLAGHLQLGKLICVYDDNHITIEGSTQLAFTEDVSARCAACGWQVQTIDGLDLAALRSALRAAQEETRRPSLIRARTPIGYGAPHKQDTAAAHGEPLGAEEVRLLKQQFGFSPDRTFEVPEASRARFLETAVRGRALEADWNRLLAGYAQAYPELAQAWTRSCQGELPPDWDREEPDFSHEQTLATRAASGRTLNVFAQRLPLLLGGAADLAPSTLTQLDGEGDFSAEHPGCRNFHFGVREHAMGGLVNGMAYHGQLRPYGATFLVFSDYLRPTLRLAALSKIPSIFIFTHDSIGLGEDGPTHQPIEHLASLRAIPGLVVLRPADAHETVAAWKIALTRRTPVALILSRQKLPILDPARVRPDSVSRGAYIVEESDGPGEVILLATGSEVHLVLEARKQLAAAGLAARVVSMPSWELFREQPPEYQEQVLPRAIKARLAVEAGSPLGWQQWVGDAGAVIGLERFGASAPGPTVLHELGFNVDQVVQRAKKLVRG